MSDKPIYIPAGHGDAFAALLSTLPDAKAVALAIHAVRGGPDKAHNRRELFRAKAFVDWVLEMDAKGALFKETTNAN